jgi:GxxExxY protein
MPISCPIKFSPISRDEYRKLDYQVMQHVFACHNELGRLCDEVIYQNDLKARLCAAGLGPIQTEVPVIVTHDTFRKIYSLDLVVGDTSLYELKTVAALLGEHTTQILNYVLLLGLGVGKLVNFRPASVESRYVNTTLTLAARRELVWNLSRWKPLSPACEDLRRRFTDVVSDWGAFLDTALYEEALIHFCGGEANAVTRIPLTRTGIELGTQRCCLHAADVSFRVTAHTDHLTHAEAQLRRFLTLTPLRAIQWINLNHAEVTLQTLTK